jgi:hypothetical protein
MVSGLTIIRQSYDARQMVATEKQPQSRVNHPQPSPTVVGPWPKTSKGANQTKDHNPAINKTSGATKTELNEERKSG